MIADKKRKILETEICENSLLIMVGKTEQIRNGDVFYPFRQDSDFLLLTGLDIPELVLIGIKKNNEFEWRLYSESITEKEKIWGTSRLPHESLRTLSGITEVREMRYFSSDIREQLREVDHIFLRDKLPYPEEKNLLRKFRLTQYYPKIQSFNPFLRPLRIYKTTEEIECIKKAVSITHQAYNLLVKNIRPRMHEYEIEALIA